MSFLPLFLSQPSPISHISCSNFHNIALWVKRDDLLHATVSGNKFRKLKYLLLPLLQSQEQKIDPKLEQHADKKTDLITRPTIISMGGAWSNHLHALAYAANLMGFNSIGLVRGLQQEITPTLQDCLDQGMQLHFVSRENYRRLRDDAQAWRAFVPDALFGDANSHNSNSSNSSNSSNKSNNSNNSNILARTIWLPEGGSAPMALRGVAELIDELPFIPDTIVVACGTGTTLAGLVAGMQGRGRVIGIAAVKNATYLQQEVTDLLVAAHYPAYTNFTILHDYHHGGFAKTTPQLLQFCDAFSTQTQIALEPVYTGKMFYAIDQLHASGFFKQGERVLAIHTGGLQGVRGFDMSTMQQA